MGELDIKIETDAPVVGARDKAMDNYWEYMAGAKEQTQKVEALRRLADLEMERSDERFQKQMEVFGQGKEGADTDMQTLKDITYRGAIKLYEDALKISDNGPHTAGLLYQLSKAYEQAAGFLKVVGGFEPLDAWVEEMETHSIPVWEQGGRESAGPDDEIWMNFDFYGLDEIEPRTNHNPVHNWVYDPTGKEGYPGMPAYIQWQEGDPVVIYPSIYGTGEFRLPAWLQ